MQNAPKRTSCEIRGRLGDAVCGAPAENEITLRRGSVDGPPVIPWLDACANCSAWLINTNPQFFVRLRKLA